MNYHNKKLKKENISVFRKWGRKGYSLFSILGRIVKISVLSVAYLVSVPVRSAVIEQDTSKVKMEYDLDEVEVTASRTPALYSQVARFLSVIESQEIERAPAESLQDLLEYVAGVDIRQRGAEGIQADISIRGGSFDQTLILLNGINITDPQTGHHNLNLPVSLSQIERIEILEGPAARVYGPNAFSGAINIVTKQPGEKSVFAHAGGGSFGYFNANLSGSFSTGKLNHLIAGNRNVADGYIENTDFETSNLFYAGHLQANGGILTAQAGFSDKGFGANSFYTPVYPNQYEQTQTIFSSVKWKSEKALHLTPAVYWRRHEDKFMLFRTGAPDWYRNHNHHRTDVMGAGINSWFLWKGGKTAFGAEVRSENILSNVLGEELQTPVKVTREDAFFTKSKSRTTTSLFFDHTYHTQYWSFSAGIMGTHISDNRTGFSFFPGIDLSCRLSPALKLVGSWNTSLRMPTFTDLYYTGPTNLGNPELKPEKSATIEGGVKFQNRIIQGQVILFYRKGTNIIDWVKTDGEMFWQSMNHTTINSKGAEFKFRYNPQEHLSEKWPNQITIGWLFNNQTKEDASLISYYVLDNLRHKLVVSVNQPIFKGFSVDLKAVYQERNGMFGLHLNNGTVIETAYSPFWLTDLKFLYKARPFQFYVSANNLFNQEYFDLGNVVQPGLWIKAGVSFLFKYTDRI